MKKILIMLMVAFIVTSSFAQSWKQTETANVYTAESFTFSIPTNLQWVTYPNFEMSFSDKKFAYYENPYMTYGYNYMQVKIFNKSNFIVWQENLEFYIDKTTGKAHSAINSERVNKILNYLKEGKYMKLSIPVQIDEADVSKGKYEDIFVFGNEKL